MAPVAVLLCAPAGLARADDPEPSAVNAALGMPLFSSDAETLWEEWGAPVAERLRWPQESETSFDASYRRYPGPEVRLLGARPFSEVLYTEEGLPSALSIIFANKGDAVGRADADQRPGERRSELRGNQRAIEEDERTLTDALTALFGPPATVRFGAGRAMRETAKRWDWRGHTFLVSAPRGEYAALRILPPATVDHGGVSRERSAVVRERAAGRVQARPNGDVIITDIPMVNQGPKGYCVPATWERYLRYMGVPADMYALAMAGNTAAGGGTSPDNLLWGVRDLVTRAGRRLETPTMRLDTAGVARFIDRGLPLMWRMYSTKEMNEAVEARRVARGEMEDPEAWSASLAEARQAARAWRPDPRRGHLCMITGYNAKTGELAFSDSWGPAFEERWITVEEAQAVSRGGFYVIGF
jgi:hypothetical protein